MQTPVEAPLKVGLLALPETTPTTLYAFVEVFSAAGVAWSRLTGENSSARPIETRIVARTRATWPSPAGPPIAADSDFAAAGQTDLAIVTDLALEAGVPGSSGWATELCWLRQQYRGGATIASVCTGSLFLAEAGLLDGLEATTHWSAVDLFRSRYPAVRLHAERILCPAGPGHRIVTAGGPGSWEDLALYFIARYCGAAEANRITRIFVLGDRTQGQLVFSAMGSPRRHGDAIVEDAQRWLARNYDGPHPVRRTVQRSGIAERSFKRRFRAATGYSPVEYVQALRVEEAKQMLEAGRDAVERIARAVGYEDVAYFRRLFKRRTGVTPSQYRRRFQRAAYLSALERRDNPD